MYYKNECTCQIFSAEKTAGFVLIQRRKRQNFANARIVTKEIFPCFLNMLGISYEAYKSNVLNLAVGKLYGSR
jgi:putative effector of murein hydrolase